MTGRGQGHLSPLRVRAEKKSRPDSLVAALSAGGPIAGKVPTWYEEGERKVERVPPMGVVHLQGKRTGRPHGSKNAPDWVRALRWVKRNLERPDARPPNGLAGYYLALAREQPRTFTECLAALSAWQRKRRQTHIAAPGAPAADELPPQGGKALLIVPTRGLLGRLRRWGVRIPEDAALAACTVDRDRGEIVFTLISEAFAPVAEREAIPRLEPPPLGW